MKRLFAWLLTLIGMTTACGQQHYENKNVEGFDSLIADTSVVVLDVRTAEEFAESHLPNAVNIDVKQETFMEKAKALLPVDRTIAVYCRSGRRSAQAASQLAEEGYKCVNLLGGILVWKAMGKECTPN